MKFIILFLKSTEIQLLNFNTKKLIFYIKKKVFNVIFECTESLCIHWQRNVRINNVVTLKFCGNIVLRLSS